MSLRTQCFVPEEKDSDGQVIAWTVLDSATHVVDDGSDKTRCGLTILDFQNGWLDSFIHRAANCPRCNNEDVWELTVTWQMTATVQVPKASHPNLDEAIALVESGEFPLPHGSRVMASIEVVNTDESPSDS